MNVDNDHLHLNGDEPLPLPWKRPCLVPEPLRSQILKIDNFTKAVWESLGRGQDLQLLGDKDLKEIHRMLAICQPIFTELHNQLEKC